MTFLAARWWLVAGLATTVAANAGDGPHPWNPDVASGPLQERFAPPAGFSRVPATKGSFGEWLRGLPLLPPDAGVHLFDGRLKADQSVHAAVVDLDVGAKDLQQCADAVMRLRAEWHFSQGRSREVRFGDTARGAPMAFSRWAAGERPKAVGRQLVWSPAAAPDFSYPSFRRYLDVVFTWAGTASLAKELRPPPAGAVVEPGDVVIVGGSPGHAVLVADVVADAAGERRVLLLQSFMPAQQVHVLRGPAGPWFPAPSPTTAYDTPEWRFPPGSWRRF